MVTPEQTSALRVLQVNSRFNGGGVDNQTLELTIGLQGLGDEVVLAVAAGSRWEAKARGCGLRVETYERRSPLKTARIRSWVRLIRRHRVQILHVHHVTDYWPAIVAARLAGRGTRVVITRHLAYPPRRFSRWFLLRFADVVAVSQAVEKAMRRELRGPQERLHQIYGGIDVQRFLTEREPAVWEYRRRQGWRDEEVVFGVVGSFNAPRGKGQVEFLEAAARLRQEGAAARFAVVGEGTMKQSLEERIRLLGLETTTKMIPFTDDIPMLMSAFDVLVHPAISTEAFALVILEAFASGKPVIASRLDGILEALSDGVNGLLVSPGDVPALVVAMRTMLESPESRRRMGEDGCRRVRENFTSEDLVNRTRQLYVEVLSRD